MAKRIMLAAIAVFISWSVKDFVIHGVLLKTTCAATARLWRPMEEMNRPVMALVALVVAACFTTIYGLSGKKSPAAGIRYGVIFGLATRASMAFGSYSYMPIPLSLAFSWFVGSRAEGLVAGAIVGAIIKPAGTADRTP